MRRVAKSLNWLGPFVLCSSKWSNPNSSVAQRGIQGFEEKRDRLRMDSSMTSIVRSTQSLREVRMFVCRPRSLEETRGDTHQWCFSVVETVGESLKVKAPAFIGVNIPASPRV